MRAANSSAFAAIAVAAPVPAALFGYAAHLFTAPHRLAPGVFNHVEIPYDVGYFEVVRLIAFYFFVSLNDDKYFAATKLFYLLGNTLDRQRVFASGHINPLVTNAQHGWL